MREWQVTSTDELIKIGLGTVIPLPSFYGDGGEPFVVRVKRPSIMGLLTQGKIPNHLLSKVEGLFNGNSVIDTEEDENALKDTYNLMLLFAKEMLLEPTMDELDNMGISLTDAQLMELFGYSQNGVSALSNFHNEQ